ncbi:MAG: hypothetical protein Q8Q07_06630, partial [Dehalococcoidales bacterium]|nr:hypothetical protein [Dehalococcoidales bacterium]
NYRWAFINDSTINWRVSQGADRSELLSMREFARDSLSYLLKWCNETAKHEQLEIIFRPKPVTMLTEMEDFFKERVSSTRAAGLHFIKGESVREWILAGDATISSFSTTLIEAAVAGKPAYMVEPLPISEAFSADWYEYVPRLRNAAEFNNACLGKSVPGTNNLKTWAEREMLSNGDPISNLVDFIYTLAQQQPSPVGLPTRFADVLRGLRPLYLKNYFNTRTHENDTFDDRYVNEKVKEWSKILSSETP